MGSAFLITLREGLEIALVISILLAYLNKIDRRSDHRKVWLGAGSAVGISIVAGTIIFIAAQGLSHRSQEAFEGVASIVAVAFVTWMIFWMRRHAATIKGELQGRVDAALTSGSAIALPLIAFFVVVREGLETALFLFSAFRAGEVDPVVRTAGALLGLAAAAALGYLFYRGGIKLNLRTFFRITGVLLILIAASLIRYGFHELYEAGAFEFLAGTFLLEKVPVIGIISNLPSKVLVGLNGNPNWLEFAGWLGYVAVVGTLFLRSGKAAGRAAEAPAAAPAAASATQLVAHEETRG